MTSVSQQPLTWQEWLLGEGPTQTLTAEPRRGLTPEGGWDTASRGIPCPGQRQGSVSKLVMVPSPLPDKPDGKVLARDALLQRNYVCGPCENSTEHLQTLDALWRPQLKAQDRVQLRGSTTVYCRRTRLSPGPSREEAWHPSGCRGRRPAGPLSTGSQPHGPLLPL